MVQILIREIEIELFDFSIDLALQLQRRQRLARVEDLLKRIELVVADARPNPDRPGPSRGYRSDDCLIVSFDQGWYPFLDDTAGYNRPEERRWYVPRNPVLDHVIAAMQKLERPQSGGRAFLHTGGAMGAANIELVRWNLALPSKYLLSIR